MSRARVSVVRLGLALTLALLSAASGAIAAESSASSDTTRAKTPPRSVVPADSLPSEDAQAVLKAIPEPIAPGEQVPPPDRVHARTVADSSAAPRDSAVTALPDSAAADTSGIPTPTPTAPLGEGPVRHVLATDSLASAPTAAPSAPLSPAPPSSPGPSTPSVTAPDTCWRVQVAAPVESEEAAGLRAAAESQLLVPMAIENEKGRHKVRSRDCLSGPAAEALRLRAVASGFTSAFRIRMDAGGSAVPAVEPAKPAAKPAVRKPASRPKKPASASKR
jgi:hypothetical protein